MKYSQLVKEIAAMEGKIIEVSVGNIREVLKCICALEAAYCIKNEEAPSEVFAVLTRLAKANIKKVK